jgi:hypothetical protein
MWYTYINRRTSLKLWSPRISCPFPITWKLFSDSGLVFECDLDLVHPVSALISGRDNIFIYYYLECQRHTFAVLAKSAVKLKNPRKRNIFRTTSRQIHTCCLECQWRLARDIEMYTIATIEWLVVMGKKFMKAWYLHGNYAVCCSDISNVSICSSSHYFKY